MNKLYGIVIPMITPLTNDDDIDVFSLEKLTDYCIGNGLHCLYPCGTTGEMMYLSVKERKLIAEVVVKKAAGRVPVFVHVGAWNQMDTIELARHAVAIGADGIGVVTPAFYTLTDRGLIDYFMAVANSVPENFPVYLYGIKQNAVNDINKYICEKVAYQCKNVIGAKYSFPDMTRIQELMTVQNGTFDVLVGSDHMLTATYSMGSKGTVSGNAMCIKEHYTALWNALISGDYPLAARIQKRTNILNSIMMSTGKNIAAYKVLLQREGIIRTTKMRRPMEDLTAEQIKGLLTEMDKQDFKTVRL
ncbi:dihydrodipicolinate synthase family protein [Necropsobacter rosorum]|uniref:dihydrodipicolinate synthase family protein n=1 Tax=Necropsobacter rosorum TaxID=908285 RepID=UPI000509EB2D